MKKIILAFFTGAAFLMISCKSNQVLVKFKNETSEDFKQLYINIEGKEFSFDSLKSGETTSYFKVESSYGYCYIKATTKDDTLRFIPIDYVGEQLYTTGKLLMRISTFIDGSGNKHLEIKHKRLLF